MPGRWSILALLFAVRTAMAIQYQSVATVAPLLVTAYGVGIADVGLLISLYLAPGIVLALPGGSIGARFGDKAAVLAGLMLMAVGGSIAVLADSWTGQIAGRLIAGVGGVLLNVLMSKMVVDWFAGQEIATAMAVFVNSWPVGIAIALVVLPAIVVHAGVQAAFVACTALVVLGLLALALLYREPPAAAGAPPPRSVWPARAAVHAVVAAGITWAFFNAGLAMLFAFGPSMLVERGWSIEAAGSATSFALWLVAVSVPLGGYVTDRAQRPGTVIVASCLAFAVLMVVATRVGPVIPIFIAMGIVGGLPAGAIMSLPARVLDPATRAIGMGIYFTVFYIGMVLGPLVGGMAGSFFGSAAATFDLGAVWLLATCPSVWLYNRLVGSAGAAAIRAPLKADAR